MTDHIYRDAYYDYIEIGSIDSARVVTTLLIGLFSIRSVLDVGCGRGAWLSQWQAAGVEEIHGADGAYIECDKLLFEQSRFTAADLSKPLHLERRFDIVQSLEVAEHIEASCADVFIDNLTRHGDLIVFSAATPGQGGEHHVNEQPLDYWREKFAARGFIAYDIVRPAILHDKRVEAWYRYNTLIYVRNGAPETALLPAPIPATAAIRDISPLGWRTRNRLLGMLDQRSVEMLARAKHHLHRAVNARQRMRALTQ